MRCGGATGLSGRECRGLERWLAPDAFLQILAFLQFLEGPPGEIYWVIEHFCGNKAVVDAFEANPQAAFGHDLVYDELLGNVEGDFGFFLV